MSHYRNGVEARVGDRIVARGCCGESIAGVIVEIFPGATTCNAQILLFGQPRYSVTLSDAMLLEDALPEVPQPQPVVSPAPQT